MLWFSPREPLAERLCFRLRRSCNLMWDPPFGVDLFSVRNRVHSFREWTPTRIGHVLICISSRSIRKEIGEIFRGGTNTGPERAAEVEPLTSPSRPSFRLPSVEVMAGVLVSLTQRVCQTVEIPAPRCVDSGDPLDALALLFLRSSFDEVKLRGGEGCGGGFSLGG